MASFGLQNTQCITRGNKQVTSGLPSTTGRLHLHAASPKQQVSVIFDIVLNQRSKIPCSPSHRDVIQPLAGVVNRLGELQLKASSFFGPLLPTRKQQLGVKRSAPLQVSAAAQTQVHLTGSACAKLIITGFGKDLACICRLKLTSHWAFSWVLPRDLMVVLLSRWGVAAHVHFSEPCGSQRI